VIQIRAEDIRPQVLNMLSCSRSKPPRRIYRRELLSQLEGICSTADVDFQSLPVEVITAATLRLDAPKHQKRLSDTAQSRQPRLLILDPFDPAASATFRWN
jgi:hypothetical protein